MSVEAIRAKIKTIAELAEISARLRGEGKRIVLCHGVYDLLHPGHLRHLEAARAEGDVLFVTLTRDEWVGKGPGRPVFNQRLRAETLAALQAVDYVAVNEWKIADETIRRLKPHVYAKGSDYKDREKDVTGGIHKEEAAIEAVGGRIHFTDEITFSSTELLNEHFGVYPDEAQNFLKEFRTRHTLERVGEALEQVKGMKVLVIGDTIVDEYTYCQAMGKSPKETIVSTRYVSEERFAGGILACANHVAGYCRDVDLVTVLGLQEPHEEFIRKHLKPNVEPTFFWREDARTIVKRRFVDPAFLTKMFEMSHLTDTPLPKAAEASVADHLTKTLSRYDLVLVADYGHGFLSRALVELLSRKSKFLAVNTQTNSANVGYNLITKYPRVDYICIDEPEMRLAAADKYGPIEPVVTRVAGQTKNRRTAVTRGHLGCLMHDQGLGFFEVPVFSTRIVDRVGAGDAFLSITAPLAATGIPAELLGFMGNAAGALKVTIVCNRTAVEPVPLMKFMTALLK